MTANALYRYFDSRDDLLAASAGAVGQQLGIAIATGMLELPSDVTQLPCRETLNTCHGPRNKESAETAVVATFLASADSSFMTDSEVFVMMATCKFKALTATISFYP